MNIQDNFLPYEYSKMLKDLGFDRVCMARHGDYGDKRRYMEEWVNIPNSKCFSAPLWQEVEEWMWDNHDFVFCVDTNIKQERYCVVRNKKVVIILPEKLDDANDVMRYDSPITAKKERIKNAIEHLHSQLKK